MIKKDNKKRISIVECLTHPYITQQIPPLDSKEIEDIDVSYMYIF